MIAAILDSGRIMRIVLDIARLNHVARMSKSIPKVHCFVPLSSFGGFMVDFRPKPAGFSVLAEKLNGEVGELQFTPQIS